MSFSKSKLARFSDSRDAVTTSIKASTTSTNSKLVVKSNTDKLIPPKSTRNIPKLPRPVRHRSLSRPSSPTVTDVKSSRPCSVSGIKTARVRRGSLDLEKADDDLEFQSATKLFGDTCCIKDVKNSIEEVKSTESNLDKEDHSNSSESKNNVSAIPLRIKSSQVSNKESVKEPINAPQEVKKFTSASHISNISNSTSPRKTNAGKGSIKVNRNINLVNQFETKKKQLQALQSELVAKKSLLNDSYNILLEIKKRLEESGVTNIELKELNEFGPITLEPKLVENMTNIIYKIPSTLVETCKTVMNKRLALLNTLDNYAKNKSHEELLKSLKIYKDETAKIEKMVNDEFQEQQNRAKALVDKWTLLVQNSGDASNILNQVEELKDKLKKQERKLTSTTKELHLALQNGEANEKKISEAEGNVSSLKDKLKHLEQELAAEKQVVLLHKEKVANFDQKKKTMKAKIQELELKCKQTEEKQVELKRHAQDQAKLSEQRWIKEKEELLSKNKHDKQMLEKLTKERSGFETRVKTLEEYIEQIDNVQKSAEEKLNKELEIARAVATEEKVKRESLQQKYEHVQNKLIQMEVRNNQTVDMVKTKNTFESNEVVRISTEREAELYTELLATRVALKAAEEKLQSYDREKMRFLNTIESLQAEKGDNESILPLQNAHRLTELENSVNEKDEVIYRQQVEITSLTAEVENLKLQVSVPQSIENISEESELKRMLYDGTAKLENLIKKSSADEQKVMSFQHELDKRTKQLYDMENLLKARDGLITVLKAKKDELQSENNSLNKYADQIRALLIQSREEVKIKSNLLQELTINLNNKERESEDQEKRIKELECSLSITNEKRFKLQDTVGAMEKELQSIKAHIAKTSSETNSWYDNFNTHNVTIPKNRSSFTCSDLRNAKVDSYLVNPSGSTHETHPSLKSNSVVSVKSTLSDDPHNYHLDSEAVRSWLSSYQNIEDIQKRLKFLKRAFATLSKKMVLQDMNLRNASKSLIESKSNLSKPSSSCGLQNTERLQQRSSITRQKANHGSAHEPFLTSHSQSLKCRNGKSPIKMRPTPDLYYNTVIKRNSPTYQSASLGHLVQSSKRSENPCKLRVSPRSIPNQSLKSSQPASSIPIPKVRYSPLTLSSRTHDNPPVLQKSCENSPRTNAYQHQGNAFQNRAYKSYLSLFMNRENSAQPSIIVKRCSQGVQLGANYNRYHHPPCHTNSGFSVPSEDIQFASSVPQSPISNNAVNVVNKSVIQIERTQNYSQLDSNTDSTGSNVSIATVIKCSGLLNKFSSNKKYNNTFISESEYVLKLYTENHESGDYTNDVQYLQSTDVASSSDVSQALDECQYLDIDSESNYEPRLKSI